MSISFRLPGISPDARLRIVRWHRRVGDWVDAGEPLVDVECEDANGHKSSLRYLCPEPARILECHYGASRVGDAIYLVAAYGYGPAYTHRVFIGYRRGDAPQVVGRLFERLRHSFGRWQLFLDTECLVAGHNYFDQITSALEKAEVMIVVIGRGWVGAVDGRGLRRLDNPDDLHRREIAAALNRGLPILPVLVDGAAMPQPEELPSDIRGLQPIHALDLSSGSTWQVGVDAIEAWVRAEFRRSG